MDSFNNMLGRSGVGTPRKVVPGEVDEDLARHAFCVNPNSPPPLRPDIQGEIMLSAVVAPPPAESLSGRDSRLLQVGLGDGAYGVSLRGCFVREVRLQQQREEWRPY